MSTLPVPVLDQSESRPSYLSSFVPASVALPVVLLLAILGIASIWSSATMLWALWTTDALKSIGMVVPVVSFLLILRVWRSLGWEMEGTWWGLAILLFTAIAVSLRDQAILLLVLSSHWSLYFPPHSLVVFAYGCGVVLLFGGVRLFRAALFPLFLLFLVNPIPHIFNVFVDLPLQRASAHVARAFAIALGYPLSPDKLRLMFTPEFGMFIAPGCNGIRGAVTMGFIALIAGYLYCFSVRGRVLIVAGAVALGYVFNFVRLCVLVSYYSVALHFASLQSQAEMADYILGAALFLAATFSLIYFVGRLSPVAADQGILTLPRVPASARQPRHVTWRVAAMAVLVLASCLGILRQRAGASSVLAEMRADQTALGRFPQTIGNFSLVRSWNENLPTGPLLFHWAEYAPAAGNGTHVALGISPVLGSHDTLVCHSARGEDPLWQGQLTFPTAETPTNFNAALFNNGATQAFEASTLCTGASCGEYASGPTHFGLVYSRPDPKSLLTQQAQRPIPMLLRAETIDTTLSAEDARQQLAATLRAFLAEANLDQLTRPYRAR